MMSVSEFFSSDPEPPWIVDVAADLESYTDIQSSQSEGSTSPTAGSPPASFMSSTTTDFDNRTVTDMEIDIPATSPESRIDRVIAHLFMLREVESVRPFRIEDFNTSSAGGGLGRRAASRSKASRKRKFSQIG